MEVNKNNYKKSNELVNQTVKFEFILPEDFMQTPGQCCDKRNY